MDTRESETTISEESAPVQDQAEGQDFPVVDSNAPKSTRQDADLCPPSAERSDSVTPEAAPDSALRCDFAIVSSPRQDPGSLLVALAPSAVPVTVPDDASTCPAIPSEAASLTNEAADTPSDILGSVASEAATGQDDPKPASLSNEAAITPSDIVRSAADGLQTTSGQGAALSGPASLTNETATIPSDAASDAHAPQATNDQGDLRKPALLSNETAVIPSNIVSSVASEAHRSQVVNDQGDRRRPASLSNETAVLLPDDVSSVASEADGSQAATGPAAALREQASLSNEATAIPSDVLWTFAEQGS
ncbi:hypothetical protein ACOMHN_040164 [Nucella lapillus]